MFESLDSETLAIRESATLADNYLLSNTIVKVCVRIDDSLAIIIIIIIIIASFDLSSKNNPNEHVA